MNSVNSTNASINHALAEGAHGINRAIEGLQTEAVTLASTEAMETGPNTTALVNLKTHEAQAAFAAKLIETGDEMLGTLLDIHA